MKKCTKCKIKKDFIEFAKSKTTKDGFQYRCKSCVKQYQQSNKEQIREKRKQWIENNKESYKEYYKRYQQSNKERLNDYIKQRYKENKGNIKEYYNEYYKQRRQNCSLFKFKHNLRSLISNSFKRGANKFSKNAKTETILGCTIEEFRTYIESKFKIGMSFENHGEWHLDHIIPISLANTEEEVIKLNHYTNFQPLWAEENFKKSNKIVNKHFIHLTNESKTFNISKKFR